LALAFSWNDAFKAKLFKKLDVWYAFRHVCNEDTVPPIKTSGRKGLKTAGIVRLKSDSRKMVNSNFWE